MGCRRLIFASKQHFHDFEVLDSEMKRLQALGIGKVQRKAKLIRYEDKEILWSNRILGDISPQSLLDTMLHNIWLYFALCRGREHKNL